MSTWLRAAIVVAAAVLALAPELSRYRAERELFRASGMLRLLVRGRDAAGQPSPAGAHEWVVAGARRAAALLPGDPRPLIVAATARLAARRPEDALAELAAARHCGERPELDLAIGQAHVMRRDLARAQVALLRAGWLSPALLGTLPEIARDPLAAEIDRLAAALAAGSLAAVPPPPVELSRDEIGQQR